MWFFDHKGPIVQKKQSLRTGILPLMDGWTRGDIVACVVLKTLWLNQLFAPPSARTGGANHLQPCLVCICCQLCFSKLLSWTEASAGSIVVFWKWEPLRLIRLKPMESLHTQSWNQQAGIPLLSFTTLMEEIENPDEINSDLNNCRNHPHYFASHWQAWMVCPQNFGMRCRQCFGRRMTQRKLP